MAGGTYYTYTQVRPNVGSTLKCYYTGGLTGQGWFKFCGYSGRDGTAVQFGGLEPTNASFPANNQYDFEQFGNGANFPTRRVDPAMGTTFFLMDYSDNQGIAGTLQTGNARQGGPLEVRYPNGYYVYKSGSYNNPNITLNMRSCKFCSRSALQTISINTPNLSTNNNSNSYLHPKNTTQTVTDQTGAQWRYSFNGDGDMTQIQSPSGRVQTIGYDGGHRVTSFYNGEATWYYSYDFSATSNNPGTTTATNPQGGVTQVSHARKGGPPTTIVDPLSRTTTYSYDNADRITAITHPENNSESFSYDGFGNVVQAAKYPRPSVGGPTIVSSATYDAQCFNGALCHKPTTTTDPRGNVTTISYQTGTGLPLTMTAPAVGGVAATTTYNYTTQPIYYINNNNVATQSYYPVVVPLSESSCMTTASCANTTDEIK